MNRWGCVHQNGGRSLAERGVGGRRWPMGCPKARHFGFGQEQRDNGAVRREEVIYRTPCGSEAAPIAPLPLGFVGRNQVRGRGALRGGGVRLLLEVRRGGRSGAALRSASDGRRARRWSARQAQWVVLWEGLDDFSQPTPAVADSVVCFEIQTVHRRCAWARGSPAPNASVQGNFVGKPPKPRNGFGRCCETASVWG